MHDGDRRERQRLASVTLDGVNCSLQRGIAMPGASGDAGEMATIEQQQLANPLGQQVFTTSCQPNDDRGCRSEGPHSGSILRRRLPLRP